MLGPTGFGKTTAIDMFQVLHTSALFSDFRFGRGNLVQRLRSRAHRLIVRRQLKTPHVEIYQDKGNENRKKKTTRKNVYSFNFVSPRNLPTCLDLMCSTLFYARPNISHMIL